MRFFRDLLFAAGASVLLLIALEGALRLAGARYNASFFAPDLERGFALRPNAEGWELTEGENYVRINSDGLHDREHSLARPANVIRMAVLGSSETDAHQVPLEANFTSILERLLNRKLAGSGKRIEVLNFAVSGYALAQEYLTLRDKVWRYDPQIVILAHSPFTMLKNTRDVYYGDTAGSPFFVYRDGRLELESKAPPFDARRVRLKGRISDLMNRIRLASMMNQAAIHLRNDLRRLTGMFHLALAAPPSSTSPALPANYGQTWPFLDPADPPGDPRLEKTWRIGEGIIQRIQEESLQHGAEFWMVVLNYSQEVHPDPSFRLQYQKQYGLASLSRYQGPLKALAERHGFHSLILAPELGAFAAANHIALHGFWNTPFNEGHYNQAGHQVIGKLIAGALLESSETVRKAAACNVTR